MCAEEDTLDHAKKCPFMHTKRDDDMETNEGVANYLVELNRERRILFKLPIL